MEVGCPRNLGANDLGDVYYSPGLPSTMQLKRKEKIMLTIMLILVILHYIKKGGRHEKKWKKAT